MTRIPPGSESTLETLWATLAGEYKETIDPTDSIKQHINALSSGSLDSVSARLPKLLLHRDEGLAVPGDLVVGKLLGEGSMGRVYQAKQTSLHREVAVKTVAPDKNPQKMTEVLFRETWVTGWLEHPNIVPVHLLGTDAEGLPVLVMKQIEGVLWSDLLDDASLLQEYNEAGESALEWHIKTLMQVCHAVEFAHSRGIIHRDLKPSNVMIGTYGEVYALDWGLALQVEEFEDDRVRPPLPKAAEIASIAGTPAYMAPEQALGKGRLLSYNTDVYLLGAILHEIIAGAPPHQGNDLREILRHALASEPHAYDDEVPPELRKICHAAMTAEQKERIQDVKTLRRRLQAFLQHQESYRLSQSTQQPLDALCAITTAPGTALPSEAELLQIYDRFGRCHFGLQRALELWPDNTEAKESMQRALEWMIQFDIKQGQIESAARWLSELPTPNEDCTNKLEDARRQQAKEQQRLQQLQLAQGEMDLSSSRDLRRKAALGMALLWFFVSAIGCTLAFTEVVIPTHRHILTCNLIFCAAVSIVIFVGRGVLLDNHANRQVVLLFVLFCSMIVMARLTFMYLDVHFRKSIILEYVTFIHFVGMMGILYNKRIFFALGLYIIAVFASLFTTGYGIFIVMAITHPTCLVIVSWFWTEPEHQALSPGA